MMCLSHLRWLYKQVFPCEMIFISRLELWYLLSFRLCLLNAYSTQHLYWLHVTCSSVLFISCNVCKSFTNYVVLCAKVYRIPRVWRRIGRLTLSEELLNFFNVPAFRKPNTTSSLNYRHSFFELSIVFQSNSGQKIRLKLDCNLEFNPWMHETWVN